MAEVVGDPELFSEFELTCSICLDLFTDPVSTPCGHNFCQGCIGGYWASSEVCTCPLCKYVFEERPKLSINRVFSAITQKYKEKQYGAPPVAKPRLKVFGGENSGAAPSTEDVVLCDVCTGRKQKAVSSCLTCTASYCEEHLQPHKTTAFYQDHRLLTPMEALKGRTCATHGRLLEVYCRTDQTCICAICVLGEHRTHSTVSVQTERVIKQRLLGKTELDLQSIIQRRSHRLAELKERILTLKHYTQAELAEVEQLVGDVTQSVDRIHQELVGGIRDKEASVIGRGEEIVNREASELTRLQERRARLEVQATSEDHIGFLQSFDAVNAPVQAELERHFEGPEVELELHYSLDDVKTALGEIREKLDYIHGGGVRYRHSVSSLPESESMLSVRSMKRKDWSLKDLKKLKTGYKKVKGYLEDITLNPVTAYPFLILSEDRKQVKRGEKLQFYRTSSQRYDVWSCVLAKESFNSGRHYWEVNVGENKDWKLGVVTESAQRKGLFDMSPANGYYVLWWGGTHLRALTAPPVVKVKLSGRLRRVGIYLDCEEGQVIFYNAKTGSEVYAFTTPGFRDKMLPLLGTGDKEVPLVLMTTQVAAVPE
ncbi:bloodthirsty-related gene family, member 30 [Denticeps clupeoides]|uniref:Bloodthirsty-related gene family, member 30 n=1 Tax=Denticeps clupeoides TaxID=299321 RepID=A0AAY4C3R3_9TELE|nr:E3 ubiquitin/ISG15 ligase TRIM25-like [Denticeps clupeoides]